MVPRFLVVANSSNVETEFLKLEMKPPLFLYNISFLAFNQLPAKIVYHRSVHLLVYSSVY